jgi:hypothetical protein
VGKAAAEATVAVTALVVAADLVLVATTVTTTTAVTTTTVTTTTTPRLGSALTGNVAGDGAPVEVASVQVAHGIFGVTLVSEVDKAEATRTPTLVAGDEHIRYFAEPAELVFKVLGASPEVEVPDIDLGSLTGSRTAA